MRPEERKVSDFYALNEFHSKINDEKQSSNELYHRPSENTNYQ